MYNSFSYGKDSFNRDVLATSCGESRYVRGCTLVKAKSGEPHHAKATLQYGPLISDINDIFATTMLCVNERII